MNNPLVTVYITNHNYGKFIKQAIESVLSQSLQDFELLIIDDGSTDNSREIIDEYIDHPKITSIFQKNKGLNITNNVAMRLGRGKYIVRLDADDYFINEALEELTSVLEADPELGLVFPDYFLVDAESNIISLFKRHDFTTEVTLFDQPAHGACTMIRKEMLESLGGYSEDFSCQDGYELWVKFISRHKVVNVSKPLFCYRQHGTNLTRNENRILFTRAKINELYVKQKYENLDTLAIIPIRNYKEGLASKRLGTKTFLEKKVDELLKSINVKKIAITSQEKEVSEFIKEKYSNENKVVFILRPPDLSRYNVPLEPTIDFVIESLSINTTEFKAITVLYVEYPFMVSRVIDDAINTLFLYNSNSLISVREDHSLYFQHNGKGMSPILDQDKFTKLERESIFKWTGGLSACKLDSYLKERKFIHGTIGHILIDQKTAWGVFSNFDIQLADIINSQ